MTETTSIPALARERGVYSPPVVARPGVMTFLSQATLGYTFGYFILLVVQILSIKDNPHFNPFGAFFIVTLPPVLGVIVGVPVGFVIWLFDYLSDQPISRTYRSTIAILLLTIGHFGFFLLSQVTFDLGSPLLQAIFIPGILIGLLTGSRLRPWRELVRSGEARGILPRILAGLTGSVLRVAVVYMFMVSVIAIFPTFHPYYHLQSYEQMDDQWFSVAIGHFALGMIILFVRMRFELLLLLTAIANAPFVASFWMYPGMPEPLRYALFAYLIAWAIFLLSRWRQTDVALAVLNKELRYYLID